MFFSNIDPVFEFGKHIYKHLNFKPFQKANFKTEQGRKSYSMQPILSKNYEIPGSLWKIDCTCARLCTMYIHRYIFITAKFVCRKCRHLLQNLIIELDFSLSLKAENREREIKARKPKWAQETEISTGKRKSVQESGCESKKRNTHPSLKEIPTNGFANNQRQEDQEALV